MPDDQPIIRPNANGTPAVRGSRINVFHIMDHYLARRPTPWVAEFYKIPVEDADAAYAYIAEHEADLLPRYDAIIERNRRGNPPEIEALFVGSRERLMKRKAEIERERAEQMRGNADARAAG